MILIGAGIGLALGWMVFPAQAPSNAPLTQLRDDFKTDFALMAAEQYAADHEPMAALDALAAVSPNDPLNFLVSSINFAEKAGYPADDLAKMRALFNGIDATILENWKTGGSGGN